MNDWQFRHGIYAGVWDLLHPGHLFALRYAMARCDRLTVAINIDPTVDNPKKQKPIETVEEREKRLHACKYVDSAIAYTGEKELEALYQTGKYDVAFISIEHQLNWTNTHTAEPIFVPKFSCYSSTRLRDRIVNAKI